MGRLADRFGIMVPLLIGAVALGAGFIAVGLCGEPLAVRARARAADRHVRQLGHRSRRCSPTPRTGSSAAAASRSRSARRGNYLAGAIWPPILQHFIDTVGWRQTYIGIGLFCVLTMLRSPSCCGVAAARQQPSPGSPRRRTRRQPPAARPLARRAAGAALRRGRRLLRGDVDAAGPHRRLLRRPRLRRRARRRDAVADARLRHRQPARLRLHLRPHRRAAHAAARLGAAGRRAAALPAVRRARLALRDLGAVRPVPGRHRAVATRSSCASTSRRGRPARASASCSWPRCSAWRSAAGCPARSSTSPAPTTPPSLNGIAWNLLNVSIAVYLLQCSPPRLAVV